MPSPETPPVLGQWILDTRSWYPEVEKVHQLEKYASRALSLLPTATGSQVFRYVRPVDAKMALGSALLKHYAVARLSRDPATPWSRVVATGFKVGPPDGGTGGTTKPIYVDPDTGRQPVSFNVSHQAGVVAIVAVATTAAANQGGEEKGRNEEGEEEEVVQVGVDVVSPPERRKRDLEFISSSGWPAFVDMHAEVLGHGEVAYLKHQVPLRADAGSTEQANDERLRAFYALWALREAYLKLGGTGLVADWLRELEFRGFRAPRPTAAWDVPASEDKGEVLNDISIWLRGQKVEDVDMCLRSIGPEFMVATAVRTPGNKAARLGSALGPYEVLSLDEVLDFAEVSG
ncbi:hypothetical protein C7999DRAFT_32569 [Corynascus novoguineensis]|uniref:holo-[acyl-carrier-protein] synthase n=1 Tax=Corynascus novoguineensis TaxID=1126955 RepID=A0AAN7CRH8_9PEZI|nr:hypothetical protein C7999DRAFT_32569 [Corynascus novoguineensis]